jgi:membrane-associated phospholipid phosphatase
MQHLVAFLLSGIVSQLFKHIIQAPRPKAAMEPGIYHDFIEGVTHSGLNSFPSGHTTTVFAMAAILAFHAKHQSFTVFYLLMAIAVGYSRIYLGQHFAEDVVAGAIIGVATGLLVYRGFNSISIQFGMQGRPLQIRVSGNRN